MGVSYSFVATISGNSEGITAAIERIEGDDDMEFFGIDVDRQDDKVIVSGDNYCSISTVSRVDELFASVADAWDLDVVVEYDYDYEPNVDFYGPNSKQVESHYYLKRAKEACDHLSVEDVEELVRFLQSPHLDW